MNKTDLQITLKRATWAVVIFFSIAIVFSAIGKRDASLVQDVQAEVEPLPGGNRLISPEDILFTIDRSIGGQLKGSPLNSVDIARIEKALEADPFILDADVYVTAQQVMKVYIKQRAPILRIIDKYGLSYYLDKDGKKMPLSRHFAARVLTANGNIPPHDPEFLERKRHRMKDLFLLANVILQDEFYQALIEQIYVSNNGEFTLIPKVGDQKILFGNIANMEEKLANLRIFYQEGIPYEGWQKYRTIDVRFKGQVVCEKR